MSYKWVDWSLDAMYEEGTGHQHVLALRIILYLKYCFVGIRCVGGKENTILAEPTFLNLNLRSIVAAER